MSGLVKSLFSFIVCFCFSIQAHGYLKNLLKVTSDVPKSIKMKALGEELIAQVVNRKTRFYIPVDIQTNPEVEEIFFNGKRIAIQGPDHAWSKGFEVRDKQGDVKIYVHKYGGHGDKGYFSYEISGQKELKKSVTTFFEKMRLIDREGAKFITFKSEKDRVLYRKAKNSAYFDVLYVLGFETKFKDVKLYSNYEIKVDKTDGSFFVEIPLDVEKVEVSLVAFRDVNSARENLKVTIDRGHLLYPDGVIPWGEKMPDYAARIKANNAKKKALEEQKAAEEGKKAPEKKP